MDLDRVERVLRLFECSRAQELRVDTDDWRLAVRRGEAIRLEVATAAAEPSRAAMVPADMPGSGMLRIIAPLVGIFREGEPRLTVGDYITAGTPVGAIESMKILSPVVAEADGLIEEVLVEDAHPVEYGEPLFVLRLAASPGEREEER